MDTFLAILGLVALIGLGVFGGAYAARFWDSIVYGPAAAPAPPAAGPRGLVIVEVYRPERAIRLCCDRQTAYGLRRFGRLMPDYMDSRSGDRFWVLYISVLSDFDQTLAAVWDLADAIGDGEGQLTRPGARVMPPAAGPGRAIIKRRG